MQDLRKIIEAAYERRAELSPDSASAELRDALEQAIALLDNGQARVAEPADNGWRVNEWLKKAVLLYFAVTPSRAMVGGHARFFDKVPLKFDRGDIGAFGVRVVPDALARRGAYIAPGVVLMPSYVNIGAYVDSGTLIDTWATVGSCAQIGRNVHLSGGAGIGGVLEPLQATPTIIEDDCFIGARSEIVEGVVVERGAVIAMGVYIGQSTRIYHRERDEVLHGRVPAGSVVVPGSLPDGKSRAQLYCAVIVKQVDERTRRRTSLNELLRDG
ncbi:MAG: 2,3,4,5-tetrahydropyridine-2,6-dicarboxylate N-succinyltransferase [Gammaproteobacteria bacterium]|nr:2,3,4,5-tetrahydropyridine-2,6-dicarboxylate N-succinyltransferase [Gammaproteobacteria bacterium]